MTLLLTEYDLTVDAQCYWQVDLGSDGTHHRTNKPHGP